MQRAVLVLVWAMAVGACQVPPSPELIGADRVHYRVVAEVIGEAPFTVRLEDGEGVLERGDTAQFRLVFEADEPLTLEDVRWTHLEPGVGGAVFAAAGHGCGLNPDPAGRPSFLCTMELRLLRVEPGRPLEERVTLYGGFEGSAIGVGDFRAEHFLGWWSGTDSLPDGSPQGRVTVVLTYLVEEA